MNFFLKMWREIVAEKTAQWCSGAKYKKVAHVAVAARKQLPTNRQQLKI